ncbi:ATP-dependent DNA helicase RecQ [Pseudomonas sp. BIGb0408]|uniref:ATP-dependent DNA helicase RecQ n=1 Tax=Phytopseudomonas flavescens TaxID=29435 RepID=A0A7Z0BRK4_9GAMM|nr:MULTISPECIES: RecQ family ATP-dependent DNA helicase [Pseudomonas]MCW2294536.1 ATP-dependent DNA helicase RecQ [Pseudomonas sp. BIGb0408]NYH76190.1 ATP-dependent DNA helicase RecQ [Pseudomonas flavescens]
MPSTLERVFGFSQLRPGQEAVISAVLAGRSAAAIFPTGSGKSLCYQLPALHLPHLTLVVSPLLALMQDQLAFLHRHGISAASIDSAQSREQVSETMAKAKSGELKILMISVERLKNERFRNFIAGVPISLLVVDEAHCISEWGHNFRPDYLKLPDYQRQFAIAQVLLLTATATPPVIADMQKKFAIAADDVVTTGFYRPNLNLLVEPVAGRDKQRRLQQWLGARKGEPSIVYVTQQKTAEQVAEQLAQHGLSVSAYHAGMGHEVREAIQRRFMAGELGCIVATIAFGMGIDKRDIRNVVHFDLPKSVENYSQEIGRAGRDGESSDCLVLANRDSLNVLENFVYGDTPERGGIVRVLEEIRDNASGDQWEMTINALSDQSNIRQLPLKTLLVQLELRGIIAPRYAYFAEYRFKYLIEPEALLARFEGERRQFVEAIVNASTRARTWCTVDFEALYRGHQAERARVVKALDFFQERGWVELESKQMTDVYAVLQGFDTQALADELHGYFLAQKGSEIRRIQAMLELFASEQCLSHRLAVYFGDERAPRQCGHCSVCRGQVARLPEPPSLVPLAGRDRGSLCGAFIGKYQSVRGGELPSNECLARFLCGISVPLFTRLKARQISGFAELEDYPYSEVRAWLSAG